MSVANINICVDSEIEAQAQEVFTALGLDMSTAVNIFLRQAIRQHGMPFAVTAEPAKRVPQLGGWEGRIQMADDFDAPLDFQPEKPTKLPFGRGCMKGQMWMADDFDEPLEDFKEYME